MHTLTSEPSEWLVYDPNDWFTIDSHTYHRGHILDQVLCGGRGTERKGGKERWDRQRIKRGEMKKRIQDMGGTSGDYRRKCQHFSNMWESLPVHKK